MEFNQLPLIRSPIFHPPTFTKEHCHHLEYGLHGNIRCNMFETASINYSIQLACFNGNFNNSRYIDLSMLAITVFTLCEYNITEMQRSNSNNFRTL
jgi:hypothetical protein